MTKIKNRFTFTATLEHASPGGFYAVPVPANVTQAIGKRGPIPVTAEINERIEFIASLYPAGGGRHGLRLNTSVRKAGGVKAGDRVRVRIKVHERAPDVTLPDDLTEELRSEGALDSFRRFAMGKQRHIIDWIEGAARPETRAKRIRLAIEAAHRGKQARW